MKRIPASLTAALASLAAIAFIDCNGDVAGTSTETISGKTTGIIHLADGRPAAGAKVRVYPIGYRPLQDTGATAAFKTSTDDNGRYYIDSLAATEYNILSDLKGQSAYQDSVFLSGTARTLATSVLADPGILCGYVALQDGDAAGAASVQVLGTQAFANVDDDGFFELPALAPGRYRAAITVALENYNVLYAPITIVGAGRDTLQDSLRPKYTGIPLVMGLKAEFDTLSQVVHLSWNKSKYFNLLEYIIYRDPKGAAVPSYAPIATVTDTVFADPLWREPDFSGNPAFSRPQWEYRVAIRDKFRNPGRTFGGLTVDTPPREAVSTLIEIRAVNTRDGLASIGDTAYLVAQYANPNRGFKQLRWFRDGSDTPVRTVLSPPISGADTFVFVCPKEPGRFGFRVELADDGGAEWGRRTEINVVLDAPTVNMPEMVSGSLGDTLRLQAPFHDELGRIVKKEWDIGAKGIWIPSVGNDTLISLPNQYNPSFVCRFRVTDDDGLTAMDSTLINVSSWFTRSPMPLALTGHGAAAIGSRIFIMGGIKDDGKLLADVNVYDTATDSWSAAAPMNNKRTDFASAVFAGKLYVFGGNDQSGNGSRTAEVYDPVANVWTELPEAPGKRFLHAVAERGGRFYLIGGRSYDIDGRDRMKTIDVFDPVAKTWSSFDTNIPFENEMSLAEFGPDLYLFSKDQYSTGKYARFDPVANVWNRHGSFASYQPFKVPLNKFSVVAGADKIQILGGLSEGTPPDGDPYVWQGSDQCLIFDPITGKWDTSSPMREPKFSFVTVRLGPTLFNFGGVSMRYIWHTQNRINVVESAPAL